MKITKSVFNPEFQHNTVTGKLVVALERIAESFRVLQWNECKQYGLSPIQVQLLIFMHTHPPRHCTVSYLAMEFNMTKATISDAIRVLLEKKIIRREKSPADNRSFTLSLTNKGKLLTEKLSAYANPLLEPLEKLNSREKETLLTGMLKLIYELHQSNILTIQRMCFTCRYYKTKQNSDDHYCSLLQTKLKKEDLRIDCPEHEYAA